MPAPLCLRLRLEGVGRPRLSQLGSSAWQQVYRLLCKRAPLLPEIAVEFATLPLMDESFRGTTVFAPIPGSTVQNASRDQYLGFLARDKWASLVAEGDLEPGEQWRFVDWARCFEAVRPDGRRGDLRVKRRGGGAVAKKGRCAPGIHFPYELLGIFIGAWCAMMVPHVSEEVLLPVRVVPVGAQFLALLHPHYGGMGSWVRSGAPEANWEQAVVDWTMDSPEVAKLRLDHPADLRYANPPRGVRR